MFIRLLLTTIFLLAFLTNGLTKDYFNQFYKQYVEAIDENQLSKIAKSFEEKTKNNQDNSSEIYGSLVHFYKKKQASEKLDVLIEIISRNDVPTKELSFVHYLLGKLVMTEFNSIEVSSHEYKTAIELSKKTRNDVVTALSFERLARNYTTVKDWKNAVVNFESARNYAKKTKLYFVEDWLQLYNNSAYAYERNNDFKKARKSIATIKKYLKNLNPTSEIYKKVSFSSKSIELMLNVRQYKTAKHEKELEELFEYIMRTEDGAFMAGYVAMGLLESYQYSNNQSQKILGLIEKLDSYINYEYELTEKLTDFYRKKNLITDYVTISKRLHDKMKSVHQKQEELNHSVLEKFYFKRLKLMNSNYQLKKENLKTEKSANFYFQFSLVILSLIFLIIVYSLYIKKVNKIKLMQQEQYILEQKEALTRKEFELMENEVNYQQNIIANLTMNIDIKNQAQKAFADKLSQIKRKKDVDVTEVINELYLSVSNLINIDKKAITTKETNDKEKKVFALELAKLHPELTKTDINYCCYFRLKLSAKEIGMLNDINDVSVRVIKNRIKNKLGLSQEQSLEEYLDKIKFNKNK